MKENEIKHIQDLIGYTFKNQDLLIQAFTRRSYSKENGGEDNEVLEFIGDKALDLIIVKLLSEKFGYYTKKFKNWDKWGNIEYTGTYASELTEGELTEIKAKMVQKNALSDAIYNLDLEKYLIMNEGDKKNNVQDSPSVKEDLFEAIIGAIALDSNWDLTSIQESVEVMLNPDELIDSDEINYITEINEWTINEYGIVPRYCIINWSQSLSWYFRPNPSCICGDVNNATKYVCEIVLGDIKEHFAGFGPSKSLAKKEAAKLAYEYLEQKNLLFSIKNEIDNPNRNMAINQLETLSRRAYFSLPTYKFTEYHDENGNPIWNCECHIEEYDDYYWAESSSKKESKKDAAWEMLKYVLEIDEN